MNEQRKEFFMKTILKFGFLLLLGQASVHADQILLKSPNIQEKWGARIADKHSLFETKSCLAEVKGKGDMKEDAYLQVLSVAGRDGYSLSTVYLQLLNSSGQLPFHEADLVVYVSGKAKSFRLLPAGATDSRSESSGLIAKVQDRDALIKAIIDGTRAVAQVKINQRVVGQVQFSLSGSTLATTLMSQNCK